MKIKNIEPCAISLVIIYAFHIVGSESGDIFANKSIVLSEHCVPFAFADFDADKTIEIYCAQSNRISVVKLSSTTRKISEVASTQMSHKYMISGVLAVDLDFDSIVDTVVFIDKSDSFFVYWGNGDNLSDYSEIKIKPSTWPIVTSLFKDSMELFGNFNDAMGFVSFRHNRSYELIPLPVQLRGLDWSATQAFVDLTDDMVADFFFSLTDKSYEVWSPTFPIFNLTRKESYSLPSSSYGHVFPSIFIDVDADNTLNHVVPVCLNKDCSAMDILVRRSGRWESGLAGQLLADGCRFVTGNKVSGFWGSQTPQVFKSVDFNLDNYPDIMAVCEANGRNAVALLRNREQKDGSRKFVVTSNDLIWFNESIVLATFFDIDENGFPDILVCTETSKNDQSYRLSALENPQSQDAYFFKVMAVGGGCRHRGCSLKSMPRGDNFVGSSTSIEITNKNGRTIRMKAAQSTQSNMFALQLPYVTFGLGDIPSFVEFVQLCVGKPIPLPNALALRADQGLQPGVWRTWTQMIPNSQVVVVPYPIDKPYYWRTSLYINPSRLILYIAVVMAVLCVILVCAIIVLQIKEKREDDQMNKSGDRYGYDNM